MTDDRLDREIEPVLDGLKRRTLLRHFAVQWVGLSTLMAAGSIWASEKGWAGFDPSAAWILTVVLGPALIAGGTVALRAWGVRLYLRRTDTEIRAQVARDWAILNRPGWARRLTRFSLYGSVAMGGAMGTFLALAFPEERLLGSFVLSVVATIGLYVAPITGLAFGLRALMVRALRRRVGGAEHLSPLPPGEVRREPSIAHDS